MRSHRSRLSVNCDHSINYLAGDIINIQEESGRMTTVEVLEYSGFLYFVSMANLLMEDREIKALPLSVTFSKQRKVKPFKNSDSRTFFKGYWGPEKYPYHAAIWSEICDRYSTQVSQILLP